MEHSQEVAPQGGQFLDSLEYPEIYSFFRNNFDIQLQENEIDEIQQALFHFGKAIELFAKQKGSERA